MFFRRQSETVRKSVPSRRPTAFRPGLEALEARDVPSAVTYTDTLRAWGTGAGTAGRNGFYYDVQGTLSGQLPGSFSTRIDYRGVLGTGINPVSGGDLNVHLKGTGAAAGDVHARLTGGSIQWNPRSQAANVTITFAITGGSGAYAYDTGTATFHGTMDRNSQILSGSLTVSLQDPGTHTHHTPPPPPTRTPPPGDPLYSDTLQAVGVGAGAAGGHTFFYDTKGSLTGGLPGTFSSRVYYVGPLGTGSNAIVSGNWSAHLGGSAGAGTLEGTIAGGSIRWGSRGQAGDITVTFTVTGGTGAYAHDTGTGTFRGTIDFWTEAISGTLSLPLQQR